MIIPTPGLLHLIHLTILPIVAAVPMKTDAVMAESTSHVVAYGQRPAYRTVVVVMCILYASLLALAHGEQLNC